MKCFVQDTCLLIAIVLAAPAMLSAEHNTVTEQQQADGWKSLFNGTSLDGWSRKSGFATYAIEDGAVVGTTAAESPNTFLCTDETYADFELTFEVLLHDNELNSGVQIRSKLRGEERGGRVFGPQVEVEASPGQAGFIYGEQAGGWQSPEPESEDPKVNQHSHFKNQEWNRFRVRAEGRRIQTWINGHAVADLEYDEQRYKDNPEGLIGLQVHGVGKSGPYSVRWRNILIRPMTSSKP